MEVNAGHARVLTGTGQAVVGSDIDGENGDILVTTNISHGRFAVGAPYNHGSTGYSDRARVHTHWVTTPRLRRRRSGRCQRQLPQRPQSSLWTPSPLENSWHCHVRKTLAA